MNKKVKRVIGGTMVALPFIAVTVYMIERSGFEAALITWGLTAAIGGVIGVGFALLQSK